MAATLPTFEFSTQEDWYFELVFVTPAMEALSLAGRVFEIPVTVANDLDPKTTLTMADGRVSIKTGTTNVLAARLPKTEPASWQLAGAASTLITVDVMEVVDGERHRFMPARVTYGRPNSFSASNVVARQVTYAAAQVAIVSPVSLPGPQGRPPAHLWVGTALAFQAPDGSYGAPVDLRGPRGAPTTVNGLGGAEGITLGGDDIEATLDGETKSLTEHLGDRLRLDDRDGLAALLQLLFAALPALSADDTDPPGLYRNGNSLIVIG